jgi:hypothetical protein
MLERKTRSSSRRDDEGPARVKPGNGADTGVLRIFGGQVIPWHLVHFTETAGRRDLESVNQCAYCSWKIKPPPRKGKSDKTHVRLVELNLRKHFEVGSASVCPNRDKYETQEADRLRSAPREEEEPVIGDGNEQVARGVQRDVSRTRSERQQRTRSSPRMRPRHQQEQNARSAESDAPHSGSDSDENSPQEGGRASRSASARLIQAQILVAAAHKEAEKQGVDGGERERKRQHNQDQEKSACAPGHASPRAGERAGENAACGQGAKQLPKEAQVRIFSEVSLSPPRAPPP